MTLLSREPLAVRAAIVAAVTGALHALVVLGVVPIDQEAETAIAGAVDLLGTAVLVAWTRGKVTPVSDPRLPVQAAERIQEKPASEPGLAPEPYTPKHAAPEDLAPESDEADLAEPLV